MKHLTTTDSETTAIHKARQSIHAFFSPDDNNSPNYDRYSITVTLDPPTASLDELGVDAVESLENQLQTNLDSKGN